MSDDKEKVDVCVVFRVIAGVNDFYEVTDDPDGLGLVMLKHTQEPDNKPIEILMNREQARAVANMMLRYIRMTDEDGLVRQ